MERDIERVRAIRIACEQEYDKITQLQLECWERLTELKEKEKKLDLVIRQSLDVRDTYERVMRNVVMAMPDRSTGGAQ
jgi:hypothetical protein